MCLFILSLLVYITSFITMYITFKWFRCGHQQSNPFGYWQSNPWDLHAMIPGNKVRFNIQLTVSSLNTGNAANFSTLADYSKLLYLMIMQTLTTEQKKYSVLQESWIRLWKCECNWPNQKASPAWWIKKKEQHQTQTTATGIIKCLNSTTDQ